MVISVGAESSHTAADFARHAEQAGADAVMAVPPIAIASSTMPASDYYRRIFAAVQIPVVVQDASGYVGRPMSIALQTPAARRVRPAHYFKPEAVPIGPRTRSRCSPPPAAERKSSEGTGGIALVDSFQRGIVGTMPGADLIEALVALWRHSKPETSAVPPIWPPLAALISLQHSLDAFLAIEKYLLVKQGIFTNTLVRGPVGYQLDDRTRQEVDRLFDRLMDEVSQPAECVSARIRPESGDLVALLLLTTFSTTL